MPTFIGTSGWQYKDWAGAFYPPGEKKLLTYYASHFRTVEVNASFYRLPEKSVFSRWAGETPTDFIFAVKASRFLTHMKKLKDPKEPIERLMERADGLKEKLRVILVQLPASFPRRDDRLEAALAAFPPDVRIAVEFRHESWFVDNVQKILFKFGAALCLADRGGRLVAPPWRTTDWGYLRLHQGEGSPLPCYERATLVERARNLREIWGREADTYVYFNNDTGGCAIRDAVLFANVAEGAGLEPSRASIA